MIPTHARQGSHQAHSHRSTSTLGEDAVRRIVRDEIDARLGEVCTTIARILGNEARDCYSTRRGHGPPDWSDDAWKSVAENIPGAYRPRDASGKFRRWWKVPRAAFEAWERSQAVQSGGPGAVAANDAYEPAWSPRQALLDAGLRVPAGGRR